jgi:hypothetical protein
MKNAPAITELQPENIVLELKSIDQMYLDAYAPNLTSEKGIAGYLAAFSAIASRRRNRRRARASVLCARSKNSLLASRSSRKPGRLTLRRAWRKVITASCAQVHFGVNGQVRRESDLHFAGREPHRIDETADQPAANRCSA